MAAPTPTTEAASQTIAITVDLTDGEAQTELVGVATPWASAAFPRAAMLSEDDATQVTVPVAASPTSVDVDSVDFAAPLSPSRLPLDAVTVVPSLAEDDTHGSPTSPPRPLPLLVDEATQMTPVKSPDSLHADAQTSPPREAVRREGGTQVTPIKRPRLAHTATHVLPDVVDQETQTPPTRPPSRRVAATTQTLATDMATAQTPTPSEDDDAAAANVMTDMGTQMSPQRSLSRALGRDVATTTPWLALTTEDVHAVHTLTSMIQTVPGVTVTAEVCTAGVQTSPARPPPQHTDEETQMTPVRPTLRPTEIDAQTSPFREITHSASSQTDATDVAQGVVQTEGVLTADTCVQTLQDDDTVILIDGASQVTPAASPSRDGLHPSGLREVDVQTMPIPTATLTDRASQASIRLESAHAATQATPPPLPAMTVAETQTEVVVPVPVVLADASVQVRPPQVAVAEVQTDVVTDDVDATANVAAREAEVCHLP